MRYLQYGITISLLKEEEIEMVRQWRNDPVVVQNYAYREHITPEMQKKWFESILNINSLYMVIEYEGEKVGVINLKNMDWNEMTFEGGIFIPFTKYHSTPLPAVISLITTEVAINVLNFKTGYAHVLKTNKQTQAFIRQLGYVMSPGQEDAENQEYRITRETYESKAERIRTAISVLMKGPAEGRLLIETSDFDDERIIFWEEKIRNSPSILHSEVTREGRLYFFS
jgi:RimJ/RimL family protein N-acetyltransferase